MRLLSENRNPAIKRRTVTDGGGGDGEVLVVKADRCMSVEGRGVEGAEDSWVRIVDMVVDIVGEGRVGIENVVGRADGIVEVVFADNAVVEVVSAVRDGMALKVSQQQPRMLHGGIPA
jgi:hypothetical protein